MKYITLFIILLFITACSHLSDLEIAQQDKEKNIVVIIPLQDNSTNLTYQVREQLARESKLYLVSQKEIKDMLETKTLKAFDVTDENSAIQIAKKVRAQTVIFSTFPESIHHIKEYEHTKTKCSEGKCWQIRVSCRSNTAVLSGHLKIVDLSTMRTLFDNNISKSKKWEICADETVESKSTQSQLNKLSKEIANEITRALIEAL